MKHKVRARREQAAREVTRSIRRYQYNERKRKSVVEKLCLQGGKAATLWRDPGVWPAIPLRRFELDGDPLLVYSWRVAGQRALIVIPLLMRICEDTPAARAFIANRLRASRAHLFSHRVSQITT